MVDECSDSRDMGMMIKTYSEYIRNYIRNPRLEKVPGEHHFVAAYLVPRLFKITGKVPDQINPDGSKSLVGDILYQDLNGCQLCIEVKLQRIWLTKNEYNLSIHDDSDRTQWPDLFIGICSEGIVVMEWEHFQKSYRELVIRKRASWNPESEIRRNSPSCKMASIFPYTKTEERYEFSNEELEATNREQQFMNHLRDIVGGKVCICPKEEMR